jgi:hypothetical protein
MPKSRDLRLIHHGGDEQEHHEGDGKKLTRHSRSGLIGRGMDATY